MRSLLFSLLYIGATLLHLSAQECVKPDEAMRMRLKSDLIYLADDKLQGRMPGTEGERQAREYIAAAFQKAGLKPAGDKGTFFQAFTFPGEARILPATQLKSNKATLALGKDFYPVFFSANATLGKKKIVDVGYGIEAPELSYSDYSAKGKYKGKVFLMKVSSPDGIHPHSKYLKYHDLLSRIAVAVSKGAAAVFLYNDDPNAEDPDAHFRKLAPAGIPVVFLTAEGRKRFEGASLTYLRVAMEEVAVTGYNVVGMLDHQAPSTVVVGAHYDHLGWGDEGSRHTGDPAIHNGADDNASGTAALMELARYYTSHDLLFNNNYLFVAFSAEEKGLIGSKFMAEHLPVPAARINYMINMDMVGRLDKAKSLAVSGVGTCPTWPEALDAVRCFDWGIKTSESGAGPSDHTSFYLKNIPVLHFFTGTHSDYHKPSDDSDKINYDGLAEVTGYIATMINGLNDKGKLAFTKTQDAPAPTMSRSGLSVTMGIMPDYVFEGEGVKIDGVSENRPAAIAGVKPGDILLQLGDYKLRDVQGYMQALGGFAKGDKTTLLLRRGQEELTLEVAF